MPSKLMKDDFIRRSNEIHNGKYDYSRVIYCGTKGKITIGCPKHGWFEQTAETHLYNKSGCPICADNGLTQERFWSFVNRNGPKQEHMLDCCWVWTGSLNRKRYGQFRNGKMVKAHSFSYELHFGKIPTHTNASDKLFVLHHCDNPSCVCPSHLFLGTHRDNMKDMVKKGRRGALCGDRARAAKKTWNDVNEIRNVAKTGKYSQRQLGKMFNLSQTAVGNILREKTWKKR